MRGRSGGRGWGVLLRAARRDALRHRGRSVLVLVMVALPVTGVSAALVIERTSDVTAVEGLPRTLGSAEALVTDGGSGPVVQLPDPDEGFGSFGTRRERAAQEEGPRGPDAVRAVLGGVRLVPVDSGVPLEVVTDAGLASPEVRELDAADPLAEGLFELVDGRWTERAGEVLVNAALLGRGAVLGEPLVTGDGAVLDVVGVAEATASGGAYPTVVGHPGTFELPRQAPRSWLVGGDPVSWEQVRELNAAGLVVRSRAVLLNPPPASELPPELAGGQAGIDEELLAVAALVVVMALVEVVLLAGPAFAVGARRQARTAALMAASGATPAHLRRLVLASGVVLGGVAAVAGTVLGVLAAVALAPLAADWSNSAFGPLEVPWLRLLVVAALGFAAAVLAAAVPARLAARQDVVAVLAGRRGDGRASRRTPVLGLVVVAAGVAMAALGALGRGTFLVAASSLVLVLGMLLVVPLVVDLVGKAVRRAPLPVRYAARDAARHRSRTVPAVAAVAATVAGVVALGIGAASDERQNELSHMAVLPAGTGAVSAYAETDWAEVDRLVEQWVPGVEPVPVRGVPENTAQAGFVESSLVGRGGAFLGAWVVNAVGSSVVVADPGVPWDLGLGEEGAARARAVLADEGLVLVGADPSTATAADVEAALPARVRLTSRTPDGQVRDRTVVEVPVGAAVLREPGSAGPLLVVAPDAVERLGLAIERVGTVLPGPVSRGAQTDLEEALAAARIDAGVQVERGYEADGEDVVVQLILFGLGLVLVLGGTLTATALALNDAAPDLATLGAVGAAPRTRRAVAASYALVVGLTGAVLGALVGAVPGVAIAVPLTRGFGSGPSTALTGAVVDVPWLLVLAVVVGLPLLAAALVAATTRSRLPVGGRMD